jgi:uncharacterized protein YutE (UPF0331/DUF86 family)
MDNDVIANKIERIRRCITRVELKCPGSANQLAEDYDLQDIISVNLERAIQSCVDIATHIIASLEMILWQMHFVLLKRLQF